MAVSRFDSLSEPLEEMSDLTSDDKEAIDRLDKEVYLLLQASEKRGQELDVEYAEQIMRGQLEEIANLTESLSNSIGSGEMISITKPSELE